MAAQRLEEELRLKRNLDERMREKQEEARAREKIRLKLGEPLGSALPCLLSALHNWKTCGEKAEAAQIISLLSSGIPQESRLWMLFVTYCAESLSKSMQRRTGRSAGGSWDCLRS